jgi:hypothetical protein
VTQPDPPQVPLATPAPSPPPVLVSVQAPVQTVDTVANTVGLR